MTTRTDTGTLRVPGATLHYEKRGSGPVLLLIPGGAADAGLYEGIARRLADRYTVVSYDPRGLSRSPLDGPLTDQRVDVWSDDAHRLLDLLAPHGGARVMGSSSGAVVALGLLARHPGRLHRVVAHEPPLLEVLADPAPHRALFEQVREVFRAEGTAAAMARMAEGLAGEPQPQEQQQEPPGGEEEREPTALPPEIQEMAPRMHANLPVFLEHILCPFSGSAPDLPALRRSADRLVLAAGRDSRGQMPLYGPAARLAELLGTALVEFPGGHLGSVERPEEFAGRLLDVLE